MFIVLCLPYFSPHLLNFALSSRGIDFVKCPIRQASLKLLSAQCILSFPLAESRALVTANELEISYKNNTILPVVHLASLTIELPNSFKVTSEKNSSISDIKLPVSEFHLKKGSLFIGQNSIAEFNIDLFDLSKNGHGFAKIKFSPIDFKEDSFLKSYLERFKLPLQLHGGTVEFQAELAIKDLNLDKDSVISINTQNLSGRYDELEFKNLSISNISFTGYPLWENKKPANISIESINTNTKIVFEKIQLKLNINNATSETSNISMKEIKANIWGGQISSKLVKIENYQPQPFIVDLDAIDLSALFALSGKAITGTGKISGKLPVEFLDQKPSVTNGTLQSLAPGGALKYTPSVEALETAKQNQEASFALKALEQFYYDDIKAKLQYSKEGLLLADISLLGNSVQAKDTRISNGRKIQFNINLEENILSLLKSLRLTTQVKKEDWVN